MDPDRKRKIRLVVALSAAVLLAVALIYTSFSASSEAKPPSEVIAAGPSDQSYQVSGTVVKAGKSGDDARSFYIADDADAAKQLHVLYPEGIVPDPFREGREILITGTLNDDGTFAAEKDSLITKCPSKFSDDVSDPTNVQFTDQ
jgi:cytochrome c-type biogenesis protein CcmE